MNVYVFRVNYNYDVHPFIKSEILKGKLRQGWGCEGTDARGSLESFARAGREIGGWEESDAWFSRRYNIIRVMLEMEAGDIIVVPKLNMRSEGFCADHFTLFTVTEGYTFEPVPVPAWRGEKEFGHVAGVNTFASFSYSLDEFTRIISAKFKGYQRPVNRVYSEAFINAVNELTARKANDSSYEDTEDKFTVDALASAVAAKRNDVLKSIVDTINNWKPGHLEEVITQLFVNNGFIVDSTHKYDRQGGDIDVSFTMKPAYSFIGDIALSVSDKFSEVRVQAKNKTGSDANDREGIYQLLKSEGHEHALNILISTTPEFSDNAREEAAINGVILISGLEFADLLLKYGLVFTNWN